MECSAAPPCSSGAPVRIHTFSMFHSRLLHVFMFASRYSCRQVGRRGGCRGAWVCPPATGRSPPRATPATGTPPARTAPGQQHNRKYLQLGLKIFRDHQVRGGRCAVRPRRRHGARVRARVAVLGRAGPWLLRLRARQLSAHRAGE